GRVRVGGGVGRRAGGRAGGGGRGGPPAGTPAAATLPADNFAEAGSNEYGGALFVVAASISVPPFRATPAPVSKPGPPQVTASRIFLPVGCTWRTKASWSPAPKLVVVPAT